MAKKKSPIEKLAALSEDIEGLSFSDYAAWQKKSSQLNRLTKSFGKVMPEATALCNLASNGLKLIGNQTIMATLTGVETILNALSLSEKFLADDKIDADLLQQAQAELEDLLKTPAPKQALATAIAPDAIDGTVIASLDDAAAYLIQLDPGNLSDVAILGTFLQDQISQDGFSTQCRLWLEEAIDAIDTLNNGQVELEKAQELIDLIGRRLENVMDELSGAGHADVEEGSESMTAEAESVSEDDVSTDHMPEDMDLELLNEFIAESTDLIAAAEEALLLLETAPDDTEAVGKVFRAFHTVKGTAAFLDLHLIADLGHHAETLFSRVRDGEIRYSGGYADLSLRALDMIKELVISVQQALNGTPLLKPPGYDDLKEILIDPEANGLSEDFDDMQPPRVGDILVAQGKAERTSIEDAIGSHPEEKMGVAMVKSQAASVTDVGQALRTQKRMTAQPGVVDSSVRVSTQRLDRLIDMVGELVIAFSMVAQDEVITQSDNHDLPKKVNHASKIVRELQDISMSMRMVPLKGTFNKMARLVRDLSRKVGKNVNFSTEGEDTEIDRNLVDIINDPLVHMVRNAVDHGIEAPDQRVAAGKSQTGEIKLCAYHSAGCVVVEIEDDGKGLNRESIVAKAKERGLIPESVGPTDTLLSDREVYNMIFEPGFSTAETVTDVSGRGVGMDVVKKNIESLRGQAEIRSEPGRGSVFKLSLPLTLAIIDGMVIRVGQETYVIPTVSIIRSVRPEPENISTVLNQGEMMLLQDTLIPLHRLAQLYHLDDANEDLMDATIVVVEDDERQVGFVVDELVGRQQVVIKSLGETMQDIPGISGGAIMPDGRVGLILDVGGLMKFATEDRRESYIENPELSERKIAAA